MFDLLVAVLAVLATWTAVAGATAGWGLALRRCFSSEPADLPILFRSVWIGYAAIIGVCQVWHLGLAVDGRLTWIVGLLGWLGLWFWGRQAVLEGLRRARRHPRLGAVIAVVTVWMAHWSCGPCRVHDSLMYHIAAVRWANEFPIVPGLGNLQAQLGFNNANFLFDALLEVGFWQGRSFHVAAGWMAALFLGRSLVAVYRVVFRPVSTATGISELFYACMLPLPLNLAGRSILSSHASDLVADMLAAVVMGRLIEWLVRAPGSAGATTGALPDSDDAGRAAGGAPERDGAACDSGTVFLETVFIAAAMLCVKLSMLGFALGVAAVAGWVWYRRAARTDRRCSGQIVGVACAVALLLACWCVRGAILTGHLAFPVGATRIELPWTVPADRCEAERDWVRDYGRALPVQRDRIADKDKIRVWGRFWMRNVLAVERDRIVMPVLGTLVLLLLVRRRSFQRSEAERPDVRWMLPALLPVASALAVWAWGSPSPRFGHVWFGIGYAIVAVRCAGPVIASCSAAWQHGAVLAALVVPMLLVAQAPLDYLIRWRVEQQRPPLEVLFRTAWMPDLPAADGFPPTLRVPAQPFVTRHGLTLWVPADGAEFTWDFPLPATHVPDYDLRLRQPDDLASGFVIDRTHR